MEITENTSFPYIDVHTHTAGLDSGCVVRILSILNPAVSPSQDVPYSAGMHPKDIGKFQFDDFLALFRNATMIGETGLDRTIDGIPLAAQTEIFIRHAEIAEALGIPLVIHCVRANTEIIQLKKDFAPFQPWIIHGFRGNAAKAAAYTANGFYLSFGYGLLRDAGNTDAFFSDIPADKMLFETDGQADIKQIYSLAASMLELPLENLKERVYTNFKRIVRASL